jgi:serine/threonine-protein kinase
MNDRSPNVLGPYSIEREIGRGGMGIVYLARDPRLQRVVALKRLAPELAADPARLARFEREARLVASLNHPNIVVLHSIEEAAGVRFVTMEYVEGSSLGSRVRPGGAPLSEVINLVVPITDALAAAHARGIVHRDLKPGNVIVTPAGRVKVLDFGLAKVFDADAEPAATEASSLTETGTVVGTVPYMAPEQLRGLDAEPRTDLFAVGVLLYELLAGRRPFTGRTIAEVASSILRDAPPPLEDLRPDLPRAVTSLLARCLAKDPGARVPTAMALGEALAACRDSSTPGIRTATAVDAAAAGGPAPDSVIPSVAVLPFANVGGDPDDEYFADGLSEELLSVLARVRGLRVAARTSSFQFTRRTGDVAVIARRLRVATVLEGTVRRAGGRIRITARLVHGSDGYPLWGETYDRELDDIFAMQDAIAQAVVAELRRALLGASVGSAEADVVAREIRDAFRGRGDDPEAYRLYLHGRYLAERFTREDLAKGIDYYRQALARQPEYASAWAGLARAYATEAVYGWTELGPGMERAREAATRAITLDPETAEAYVVLGRIRLVYDHDGPAAEAAYRRALALAPQDTVVLRATAALARNAGRLEEAIGLLRRAVAADPLNEAAHYGLAMCYFWSGALAEAESEFRKTLELNPGGAATHFYLAAVQTARGRMEEAAALIERESIEIFRLLGRVLLEHARGEGARSAAALRELRERFAGEAAYQLAMAHAVRGERDEAFAWLDRALEQRDAGLAEAKPDVFLRSLRTDPRWEGFLARIGQTA